MGEDGLLDLEDDLLDLEDPVVTQPQLNTSQVLPSAGTPGTDPSWKIDPEIQKNRDQMRMGLLQEELQANPEQTSVQQEINNLNKQYGKLTPVSLKTEQQNDLLDLETPVSKGPDTRNVVLNSATKSLASVAAGGSILLGGLLNATVGNDVGDSVFEAGRNLQKNAENSFGMTPELYEKASFGQKALGAITGAAITLPMYATPITAIAAIGLPSLARAMPLIDEGVDSTTAWGVSMMSVGANAALFKVATNFPSSPTALASEVAKNYAKATTATAGLNIVQGAGEDYATKSLLEAEHPKIAERFKPWDIETRALDAITGVVLGAGAKYSHDVGSKTKYTALTELLKTPEGREEFKRILDDTVTNTTVDIMGNISNAAEAHSRPTLNISEIEVNNKTSLTYDQFWAQDPATRRSGLMLTDYLIGALAHPEVKKADNSELAAMLRTMLVLGTETNFGKIYVNIHDVNTGSGSYWNDVMLVPQLKDRTGVETLVHEVGHALTAGIINKFEKLTSPPTDPIKLAMYERYKNMNTAFELARDSAGTQIINKLKTNNNDLLNELHNNGLIDLPAGKVIDWKGFYNEVRAFANPYTDVYGLYDIHEFMSILFEKGKNTNPDIERLRGIQYVMNTKKEDVGLSNPRWEPSTYKLFNEAYKKADDFFGNLTTSSFIKSYYDNIFGLVSDRTKLAYESSRAALKQQALAQDSYTRHTYMELNEIRKHTEDIEDFKIQASAMYDAPAWKEFIQTYGSSLFHSPRMLEATARAAKEVITAQEANKESHLSINESIDDIFNLYAGEFLKAKDLNLDLYGKVQSPDQIKNFRWEKDQKPLAELLRVVFQKQQALNAMEAKIYSNLMNHLTLLKRLSIEGQKKVLSFASGVDANIEIRKSLADQGLWWPDRKMVDDLDAKWNLKLTEDEKLSYLDIGILVDKTHKLLEATAKRQGIPPPMRIPGYMPHIWKGPYKVRIQQKISGVWTTIHMKTYNLKQSAIADAQAINKGKWNNGAEKFRVEQNTSGELYQVVEMRDFESGITPMMMQDLEAYKQFTLLSPEIQQHIMGMDGKQITGFNSHLLEGHSVKGYIGDNTVKYSITDIVTGKRYRDTRDFLDLYENYSKRVVESYKNTIYVDEVLNKLYKAPIDSLSNKTPSYANTMSRFKKFADYLFDQSANYTGQSYNNFKMFDEGLINLSKKIGVPPYAYRQIIKNMRNIMSIVFTRYNPGNWVMNYVQPIHTFSQMAFIDGLRKDNGQSTYPIHKVIQEVMGGLEQNRPDLMKAIAWARENHILDPQQEYQVRSKATTRLGKFAEAASLGNVPTKIEGNARELSYAIAFTYFNHVQGDTVLAQKSAAEMMGSTMVNYDRSRRPLMFQSYGSIGELLSPFAVYRNAYAGNTMMMVKYALSNPTQLHKWKPFIVSQVTYMMMAGMIGAIGVSEYDALLRLLKKWLPEEFGDWNDAYGLMMKAKIPEPFRVGMIASVSKAIPGTPHGIAVQGSGSAVGADDMFDPNMAPFLTAIMSLGNIGVKAALGRDITSQEQFSALSGVLPGQLKFAAEKYFQVPGSKTSLTPSKMSGGVPRDSIDELTIATFGKESQKVNEDKVAVRQLKAIEEQQKKSLRKLVDLAVDRMSGTNSIEMRTLYLRAEKIGITPEEFDNLMLQKRLERALPAVNKSISETDSYIREKLANELKKLREGSSFTR